MKRILIIIILLASFAACTHKELCYDHPHISNVNVAFKWAVEPEKVPESMSVYFFKEGREDDPLRFEFTDSTGGRIRLTPGVYHALCHNSDTRSNQAHDTEDYHSYCVSTKDVSSVSGLATYGVTPQSLPRAKSAEDERVVVPPESFWYSNLRDIVVEDKADHEIQLEIQPQLVTYNITVNDAENLKWVYGVSATLSGLAGGFHPGRGELSEERVTVSFEASMNKEDGSVTGTFTSFGHCPDKSNPHYLKIYAVLADNSWWDFTYDVTDIIHNSPDPYNLHIELDGLPIPKPVANGGGFKPTVGEWNSVEIELKM